MKLGFEVVGISVYLLFCFLIFALVCSAPIAVGIGVIVAAVKIAARL